MCGGVAQVARWNRVRRFAKARILAVSFGARPAGTGRVQRCRPSDERRIAAPTTAAVADAARRLRAGELVAFPTETVYGLGADAGNRDAVHRDFRGQGPARPIIR